MTRTRRSRVVTAAPATIWKLVSDPHHQPRWWPGVRRMEAVTDDAFTQVHLTKKGRPVRIDFSVIASDAPWRQLWQQEVAGTPFERVLGESVVEIVLEPENGNTRVTIEQRQQLRGYSRTGTFLLARATRRRLDEALDGLEQLCGSAEEHASPSG